MLIIVLIIQEIHRAVVVGGGLGGTLTKYIYDVFMW